MRRNSLRNKLKVAFLAVIILSILISGGFSYSIATTVLEKNALKLTQDNVVKSAQIVDEKLNKLSLIMMTFMISQPFKEMLKDVNAGNSNRYFTHLSELDNVFSQARIAEPLIHSIYITTPIGAFYPLSMNLNRQETFYNNMLYERIEQEQRNVWVEGHEDMLFSGKDRVISLIMEPIFDTPVKGVYIVVNIREDGLRKLLGSESEEGAARLLLNAEGVPVYAVKNALIEQAVSNGYLTEWMTNKSTEGNLYELNNQSYLLNYAKLEIADWTMLTLQSKDHVLKDMIYVKWMILFITVCAFMVAVLISGAFTSYLLKPLQGLLKVMKRVESNDLSARFESGSGSSSGDELTQVGYRFNRMLEQIVVLIEEVKEAETNKRAAEIKALSAQMDPHFLYNTLNTIYWKLNLNQVKESQKMVVSLSRLFQLGLNNGHEITTLAKELEHVRQYLELQSYCYVDLFEYDIQIKDSSLLQMSVPRIVLQPLVENCILHGFRDAENGGVITIMIEEDHAHEEWTITVRDNGQGMEEEQVNAHERQNSEHGYAITNLISRLQLYYGDQARLNIESIFGKGTAVIISLPLKGEHHDV
ncbi:sensor histidine kinase [Paenibacillus sp. FA6]|uniref:sensor histidine kinase n=1 Tax=Paenibacillus sp. FA6 TaxID=3413029 RepID=UPI003F65BC4D